MTYKITSGGVMLDGTFVPEDEGNMQWQEYTAWLLEGNAPEPPPIEEDWRGAVMAEFRDKRDRYLSRLSDIAGRYSRQGVVSVAPAADIIAQGLLDLPDSPALDGATDRASLQTAIVVSANNLLRAQLTNPATALIIKAALDKVFK